MNKLNYKDLTNYLIDILLEIYNPNELLTILIDGNVSKETLIEIGFCIDDIETAIDGK